MKKLREAFLTEEAARLKKRGDEAVNAMKEFEDFAAAEHFIRYFYKDPVTFLDYLTRQTPLYFWMRQTVFWKKGKQWRVNSGKA